MNDENNFTTAVQDALGQAQQIAITRKNQAIDVSHLFKFLVQPGELVADIYRRAGVDLNGFEQKIDQILAEQPVLTGNVSYGQTFSQKLLQLLRDADEIDRKSVV